MDYYQITDFLRCRHSIRRAAFRAISAPSSPFLSTPRSLSTSSSFIVRAAKPSPLSSVFRRYLNDDAENKPSQEKSEQSTYEAAAETVSDAAAYAKDTVTEAAESVAAATGTFGYQGREPRERQSGGYNNDRYGGPDRRDNGFGDRGGRGVRDDRSRPIREIQPSATIYVGNLLFDITAADLQAVFEEFGPVKNAKIAVDERGTSKG